MEVLRILDLSYTGKTSALRTAYFENKSAQGYYNMSHSLRTFKLASRSVLDAVISADDQPVFC